MVLSENIDKNAEIAGDGEKMTEECNVVKPMDTMANLMLPEYRQLVDLLFASKSPILIPNCSKAHATIINELIVKHTPNNGDIYFYSEKFDRECFDAPCFLAEVQEALNRDVKFHLACTGICEAMELKKTLDKIAQIKENVTQLAMKKGDDPHTTINFSTNGTAVRLEKNSCKPEADVSGNDPVAAKRLIQAFKSVCS